MKILAISAYYHDSAACILVNGKIIAAAQEERFTRIKHDASFPVKSIEFCLDYTGIKLNDLDAFVFYDKPLLKFERLLETYHAYAPRGLRSFLKSMPVWLKEKFFLKKVIRDELKKIDEKCSQNLKILFPEHHLSHAASAFFASNFRESAILTIDGVGEYTTTSIMYGTDNKITNLKEIHFPHSVGLLYSAFTFFLGFKVNSGEYKLMGLAPYGNENYEETKKYITLIKKSLVKIYNDGSIFLEPEYFSFATNLKMIPTNKWEELFEIKKRNPDDEIEQHHCNLAFAIQHVTEEIVEKLAIHAKEFTKSKNLCLAGGVALNCVINGKLRDLKLFDNIYIQPAAGDAGGAIGAALNAYHIYFEKDRIIDTNMFDSLNGSYLGPEFSSLEIEKMSRKFNAAYHCINSEELFEYTAKKIYENKVVGWFQGKMEFGPRALGNRSILANPLDDNAQKKVNLKIKYRESFRPFAPSVLEEDASKYFDTTEKSPYMLFVHSINNSYKIQSLPNETPKTMLDKLYAKRSLLPAITHVDFSARIQTVNKLSNPKFYELLHSFKKISGHGILVNTSFNVRGEPIVCTPEDAYLCFINTEMDILVINNYIFEKENQPLLLKSENWLQRFKLD